MYKMKETLDGTGHAIAEQLVRTLMFDEDRVLRTVTQISDIVNKVYSPQTSPSGVETFVTYHYKEWLNHFVMMHGMVGDKERQRLTWGHEEHFTEDDFREMCPDYWNVSRAYEDIEEYQRFRNAKSGDLDEYGNVCQFPEPV